MAKFNMVVSYATRPMRVNETQGVEHIFITNEEADKILSESNPIAYTEIGDIRYFVTKECLDEKNIYIIDPKGVESFKTNYPDIFKRCKIIYIYTPERIRGERAKAARSDFETAYKKRCEDEDAQFTAFELEKKYDQIIVNINFFDAVAELAGYLIKEYTDHTLFLIVGRTCAGKDKLTTEAMTILNN